MNCVKVSGGLGNQLFQYALAYVISKHNKVTIDISDFDVHSIHEGFVLEGLVDQNIGISRKFTKLPIIKLVERIVSRGWRVPFVHHDYKNQYLENHSGVRNGYWFGSFQSEEYFEGVKNEIKRLYREYIDSYRDEGVPLKVKLDPEAALLHIRLGDYNTGRYKSLLGGHYDSLYLENAIEIAKLKGVKKFQIITNGDVDEFLKRKKIDIDYCVLDYGELSSQMCMALMLDARIFIGWNSSLSWWGAYLRSDPDTSFLPSKWFFEDGWGECHTNSKEITFLNHE